MGNVAYLELEYYPTLAIRNGCYNHNVNVNVNVRCTQSIFIFIRIYPHTHCSFILTLSHMEMVHIDISSP